MSNTVYKMNEGSTLKFVELYRDEECLWNPFHPDYKYKGARWKACSRIANKFSIANFGPSEVAQKFKNIRSSYCQELKKIHFSIQQATELYKPKVAWFKLIDSFLKPYVAVQLDPKDTQCISVQQQKQPPRQIEEEKDTPCEMIEINDGEFVKMEGDFHYDTINNSEFYNGKASQKAKFIYQKGDHLFQDSHDPANKQTLESPEYITINRDGMPLDEYDAFARFISSQLRELPPKHAVRAQCRILQCMADEKVNYLEKMAVEKLNRMEN